jgi:membrane-bound lytic murein transglycosylase D
MFLAAVAGCATAPEARDQVAIPPVQTDTVRGVTDPIADSAADRQALDALAELEFGSLDARSDHVRGTLRTPAVTPAEIGAESHRLFSTSRGGTAGAAGPTYDIDVESFAQNRRVQYYMGFFLGPARDRFEIWLGRMNRYEGMIRETLRGHDVPQDMVFLALIESGYSNTAVSRALAVGMWQFIASTGRRYDLEVSTWVDERRDPFKATAAAARHLRDLEQQFGSWYLAAAAYNAGATRVSRGLRRLRADSADLSDTTFFDLSDRRYLRRETRDYVPKLIAAALIAKDPARYGFTDVDLRYPLVFDEITVTDATSLDVVARLADTTDRAIAELNPHYYRGVTPPGRSAIVRVPRGSGPRVARRWAELPADERVSFIEHRIARGETLSGIAQRYGVSLRLVVAANPNARPRRLRIGQRLIIPLNSAARSRAAVGRTPRAAATPSGNRYHTVRRGESLWIISQRYGVRVSDLRRWNAMDVGEVLPVGRRLLVSGP